MEGGGEFTIGPVGTNELLRNLVAPALLSVGVGVLTAPAHAALSVCNKTTHPASVALGFYDGTNWSSTGWWTVPAGDCTRVVDAPLIARYYYLYAVHQDIGGAWEGDRSFCIGMGRFNVQGRGDCAVRGLQVKKFFQVDTGDSLDWTENLAD